MNKYDSIVVLVTIGMWIGNYIYQFATTKDYYHEAFERSFFQGLLAAAIIIVAKFSGV